MALKLGLGDIGNVIKDRKPSQSGMASIKRKAMRKKMAYGGMAGCYAEGGEAIDPFDDMLSDVIMKDYPADYEEEEQEESGPDVENQGNEEKNEFVRKVLVRKAMRKQV